MPLIPVTPWLIHGTRRHPPSIIVLHATAGSTARSSVDHLRGRGLSYHYIIARDGRDSAKSETSDGTEPVIFHCAPVVGRAFHVASQIPTPSGHGACNETSIGISLANIQRRVNPEPYTSGQLSMLDALIAQILSDNPGIKWLTTHAVVQPWNRADPLGLSGPAIADRHRLTWWQPTAQEVEQYRPMKTALNAPVVKAA
jgi:N-acetyl-anhydromuramyl-L-alanine amidase AmpD